MKIWSLGVLRTSAAAQYQQRWATTAPNPSMEHTSNRLVHLSRTAAPFVRTLPPDTYVMYDPVTSVTHRTYVVDTAMKGGPIPPFTNSVFLLDSTSTASAPGTSPATSLAIVGLPAMITKVSDGQRFVDRIKRVLDQDAAHRQGVTDTCLCQLILPSFNPWAANVVRLVEAWAKSLHKQAPLLQIVTGPTMHAFLTDPIFFSCVRSYLKEQQSSASLLGHAIFTDEQMPFAAVPSEQVHIISSGSQVMMGPHRKLSFFTPPPIANGSGTTLVRQASQQPHFQYRPSYVYDHAAKHLLAGDTGAGVRLAWLPHLDSTARQSNSGTATSNRDGAGGGGVPVILPAPSLFHHRSTSLLSSPQAVKDGGSSRTAAMKSLSLLGSSWDIEAEVSSMVAAIRHFPFVQRVLCATYGETAPGRDALIDALELSSQQLTQLTKRLAKKFAEIGIKSIHEVQSLPKHHQQVSQLCDHLVTKLETEMLYQPQAGAGDDDARHARDVVRTTFLRSMASAMVYRAVEIASTEGVALLAADRARSPPSGAQASISSSSQATLRKLFESRSLGSLNAIVDREEIDLDVFLAMRHDELVKTFQISFGLAKKLELLQQDLKSKMKDATNDKA